MSTLAIDSPSLLLEISEDLPENLWCIEHPIDSKWGCFHMSKNGYDVHCLATFRQEVEAVRFAEWLEISGLKFVEKTFDETLDIARSRPAPVRAMIINCLDLEPRLFYVK